jgi:hypothetical protein
MEDHEKKNTFVFNGPVGQVGGHIDAQYIGCNFIQQNGTVSGDVPDGEGVKVSEEERKGSMSKEMDEENGKKMDVNVNLPLSICQKLRTDALLADAFIRIMRDEIVPNTGKREAKWKWSHVRKVMADDGIIPEDINDTDFGRIIGALNIGVANEHVRTNCKNNELRHLKQGCGHRYDYTDKFTECIRCMEVAETLMPVIEYMKG